MLRDETTGMRDQLWPVTAPTETLAPMPVARRLWRQLFGHRRLVSIGDNCWWWNRTERMWQRMHDRDLVDAVWVAMDGMHVQKGSGEVVQHSPGKAKVVEVTDALRTLSRRGDVKMPAWLAGEGEPAGQFDPDEAIALKDVVVDIRNSAKEGRWVTIPRTAAFFDGVVAPVTMEEALAGKTELWDRVNAEWGSGDPVWQEINEKWMGYCLMGTRKHAKWRLDYGRVRGGKGTNVRVLKMLVGKGMCKGSTLRDLAGSFGMDGLDTARVLIINEVNEVSRGDGETVASIIKMAVGEDESAINAKYVRQWQSRITAAPMMHANEMPMLPNKGQGLSSKMVVLVFGKSWAGREDRDLERKLREEVPGIARRAVDAAIRLEGQTGEEGWRLPESSKEAIESYQDLAMPLQPFLKARFVRDETQFTASSVIKKEFEEWKKRVRVRVDIPSHTFISRLINDTTWHLQKTRLPNGGPRGLRGLALKRTVEDDVDV